MNGYGTSEQIKLLTEAVKLLTEKVEKQEEEIMMLKAKPPQVIIRDNYEGDLL